MSSHLIIPPMDAGSFLQTAQANGPTSIWMVNADGLNPRLVYAGANKIVATAWSPNGERIAYAMSMGIPQEYEIFTMDADGRNHLRISQGLLGIGGSVDWSLMEIIF